MTPEETASEIARIEAEFAAKIAALKAGAVPALMLPEDIVPGAACSIYVQIGGKDVRVPAVVRSMWAQVDVKSGKCTPDRREWQYFVQRTDREIKQGPGLYRLADQIFEPLAPEGRRR